MNPGALAVGVALALDTLVGEPPDWLHPVAWFGRLVAPLDRSWTRPRVAGVLGALALPLLAAGVAFVSTYAFARESALAGALLAGLILFVSTTLRVLLRTASDVAAATETDLDAAREELLALAGRDAADLSAGEVRSAVVESLAENLADGLVAPIGAFAVGAVVGGVVSPAASLALAAAGAAWVKAVNTMDSMLGYRSKPVGWGPARLDDLVMWLPARATAILLAVVTAAPVALSETRPWLAGIPSPNSGWPMGVFAAALDVRLEKPGVYVLNAEASLPTPADTRSGVRRARLAGLLAYLCGGMLTWL